MLKLLFSMMFADCNGFKVYTKLVVPDNSLTLEVEVEELFHFVILTMDTQEPSPYLINLGPGGIKQFEKDQM